MTSSHFQRLGNSQGPPRERFEVSIIVPYGRVGSTHALQKPVPPDMSSTYDVGLSDPLGSQGRGSPNKAERKGWFNRKINVQHIFCYLGTFFPFIYFIEV